MNQGYPSITWFVHVFHLFMYPASNLIVGSPHTSRSTAWSGDGTAGPVRRHHPINHKHLYNICTMLDQRRRRWADVVQMLYKCFVFARMDTVPSKHNALNQCWSSVVEGGPTLNQHLFNVFCSPGPCMSRLWILMMDSILLSCFHKCERSMPEIMKNRLSVRPPVTGKYSTGI